MRKKKKKKNGRKLLTQINELAKSNQFIKTNTKKQNQKHKKVTNKYARHDVQKKKKRRKKKERKKKQFMAYGRGENACYFCQCYYTNRNVTVSNQRPTPTISHLLTCPQVVKPSPIYRFCVQGSQSRPRHPRVWPRRHGRSVRVLRRFPP